MLVTLTITLRDTAHQVVLSFSEHTTLKAAVDQFDDPNKRVVLTDDFGRAATLNVANVISMVSDDFEEHWLLRNEQSIMKLRAENDFNAKIQADPQLRFLVGGVRPAFGDK